MARDRKRARQRRERRAPRDGAAAPTDLHRADLPGALEHASAEVDEFDAALVRGAGGVPMPAGEAEQAIAGGGVALEPGREEAPAGDETPAQPVETSEPAPARPERRERRRGWPARALAFLRASWAELQRVQWPDRAQVSQATAVVLGFVAVAGVYLGAADWVAQTIVNFVL